MHTKHGVQETDVTGTLDRGTKKYTEQAHADGIHTREKAA